MSRPKISRSSYDFFSYLFSGAVGTLTGLSVVLCPVEGHEGFPGAVFIIHFVALFDRDPVHLDRTAVLGGHEDLGAHHLTWKGERGRILGLVRFPGFGG